MNTNFYYCGKFICHNGATWLNMTECGLMWRHLEQSGSTWRILVYMYEPHCVTWRNVVLKKFFFTPHCATFNHISPHFKKYNFVIEWGEMLLNVVIK